MARQFDERLTRGAEVIADRGQLSPRAPHEHPELAETEPMNLEELDRWTEIISGEVGGPEALASC